jgi:hypothetical protein
MEENMIVPRAATTKTAAAAGKGVIMRLDVKPAAALRGIIATGAGGDVTRIRFQDKFV